VVYLALFLIQDKFAIKPVWLYQAWKPVGTIENNHDSAGPGITDCTMNPAMHVIQRFLGMNIVRVNPEGSGFYVQQNLAIH